ncbi:toll/interleukin-1 receptor domain-containing protein [Bacillus wiedmannii]|uniref:toll/interleukin-1 receptor domain-containing protein n=1 Tax=Bacillus wiedmannii TaxID=1890302 RepID=UPI00069F4389|nr:toll/interleukin-1 receptor domain-containing protein [Bacillus wiedmannii]
MSSIFLSHNSKDKEFVRRLANRLESYGVKVWVDEAEIKVGESLIKKIEMGINEMEYLGVILSQNSIKSDWVNREVDMAMNGEIQGKKVKVLPLLYKKCEIPGFLSGKFYADFTTKKKFEEAFIKLLNVLEVDEQDDRRTSGETCLIQKDFHNKIEEYFKPKKAQIKFYEDLSGIDYLKVDGENGMFSLYSYWTKPTHIVKLDEIFRVEGKKLKDIEHLEEYVYFDSERDDVIDSIKAKYSLPSDIYPGQWTEFGDKGQSAWDEWIEWHEERRVISLQYT